MRKAIGRKRRLFLWCTLMLCALGVGSALSTQGNQTPAEDSGQDALPAEVRALRREIKEAAHASIEAQLYAVGLQLQEQRVLAAGRQLADVQHELANVRLEIAGEEPKVRHLQASLSQAPVREQTPIRQTILTAEAHIEERQRRALRVQSGESELLAAVNEARARWEDFSAKLSALESSLPETDPR